MTIKKWAAVCDGDDALIGAHKMDAAGTPAVHLCATCTEVHKATRAFRAVLFTRASRRLVTFLLLEIWRQRGVVAGLSWK